MYVECDVLLWYRKHLKKTKQTQTMETPASQYWIKDTNKQQLPAHIPQALGQQFSTLPHHGTTHEFR